MRSGCDCALSPLHSRFGGARQAGGARPERRTGVGTAEANRGGEGAVGEDGGRSRRPKQLRAVESDDTEFCIPSSWCWTRLGEVTSYIQRGKSPKYASKSGALVVSHLHVFSGPVSILNKARKIRHYQSQWPLTRKDIRFLREGDLLWQLHGNDWNDRTSHPDSSTLQKDLSVTAMSPLYAVYFVSPDYILNMAADRDCLRDWSNRRARSRLHESSGTYSADFA